MQTFLKRKREQREKIIKPVQYERKGFAKPGLDEAMVGGFFDFFTDAVSDAAGKVGKVFTNPLGVVKDIGNYFVDTVAHPKDRFDSNISKLLSPIQPAIDVVVDAVGGPAVVSKVANFFENPGGVAFKAIVGENGPSVGTATAVANYVLGENNPVSQFIGLVDNPVTSTTNAIIGYNTNKSPDNTLRNLSVIQLDNPAKVKLQELEVVNDKVGFLIENPIETIGDANSGYVCPNGTLIQTIVTIDTLTHQYAGIGLISIPFQFDINVTLPNSFDGTIFVGVRDSFGTSFNPISTNITAGLPDSTVGNWMGIAWQPFGVSTGTNTFNFFNSQNAPFSFLTDTLLGEAVNTVTLSVGSSLDGLFFNAFDASKSDGESYYQQISYYGKGVLAGTYANVVLCVEGASAGQTVVFSIPSAGQSEFD